VDNPKQDARPAHETGEIESGVGSHAEVRQAVAKLTGEGEQKKLSAYSKSVLQEGSSRPGAEEVRELRRYLRSSYLNHMVQASYWQIEKVPRCRSGKENRAAWRRRSVPLRKRKDAD